jgi:hypothetical protein
MLLNNIIFVPHSSHQRTILNWSACILIKLLFILFFNHACLLLCQIYWLRIGILIRCHPYAIRPTFNYWIKIILQNWFQWDFKIWCEIHKANREFGWNFLMNFSCIQLLKILCEMLFEFFKWCYDLLLFLCHNFNVLDIIQFNLGDLIEHLHVFP